MARWWLALTILAACDAPATITLVDGAPDDCWIVEACNPTLQTGCASGSYCTAIHGPDGDPAPTPELCGGGWIPSCAPGAPGDVGLDQPCTFVDGGGDDCAAGSVCMDGVCRPFCRVDGWCDTGICIGYCSVTCDPLAPDCAAGDACYASSYQTPGCAPAGDVPTGGSCDRIWGCVPGDVCDHAICTPLCAVGGHTFCGPGLECVPLQAGAAYGICDAPP